MAKFLTTTGVSYQLEEIIKNASDRLVIISPFLKINERVKDLLEDKNRMKIDIRVIYGKSELRPDESNWLAEMTSIRTSFRKNLHAKCYLNEHEALITSMNLYEFSQQNNDEMGILVSSDEDVELYKEIVAEARRIERASETIRVTVETVEDSPLIEPSWLREAPDIWYDDRLDDVPVEQSDTESLTTGFCIRCKDTIPANPVKPYCDRCFRTWNRYKNYEYEENHCHLCRNEYGTSMSKPACLSCYRKYRNVLEFAVS